MNNAIVIPIDARMLIGANQRTILCIVLVAKEQIMPFKNRTRSERRTISSAVLQNHQDYQDIYLLLERLTANTHKLSHQKQNSYSPPPRSSERPYTLH